MMNICGGVAEHHHNNHHHHHNHHQVVESPLSPTSAAELAIANRKFAKTCVEKKRRDRINKCLDELKEIMSQTDDKARYQKMEKAEILEMAVNYMRMSMSGGGKLNQTPSNDVYALAYNQLLADFTHSLATMPGLRDDFKAQVLNQMGAQILRNKMAAALQQQQQQQQQQQSSPSVAPTQPASTPAQPQAQKRRRPAPDSSSSVSNANKKYCVDTTPTGSAQQYFMYSGKFGGSCSSLDTNVHVPVSPCGSTTSSSCSVGGGSGCDAQALNLSSSSTHSSNSSSSSSPPVSTCSSPNSSSSMKSSSCPTSNSSASSSSSSSECFNKIFRPYL